nr:craniofacial development protein 2-like [Pelodiscus sinensis]|eukprot:XP_025037115.1 craniofacial development protein 2-like [Pelodiscus sinensis]
MFRYKINILGFSEMRWTDSGMLTLGSGEIVCYSGRSDGQHQEGVGIIMDIQAKKSLLGWEPVNSRIIRARLFSIYAKTTIIQSYALTEQATEEEKDLFSSKLQEQIDKIPHHNVLIIMGDLNAKVGLDNEGYKSCMGPEGVSERNNNRQRFVDLCLDNGLVIGGTVFQHKTIHKLTWISPDRRTYNQIDHIAINQKWRRSMRDVRALRGADANSDHHLLLCKLQLKLKRLKRTDRKTGGQFFDFSRLKHPTVKIQFTLELSNRFSLLEDLIADDINIHCEDIQKVYLETIKIVLGYKKKQRREWISDATWQLIENRKAVKQRTLAGSDEDKITAVQVYRDLNVAVKRSVRRDKRAYVDNIAMEAQSAVDRGDTRTVYKITKTLIGDFTNKSTVVRDKNGKMLVTAKEQLSRWTEHFRETLNRPDPEEEADIRSMNLQVDMECGDISELEIADAIKQSARGRPDHC